MNSVEILLVKDKSDLEKSFQIRSDVFVKEQGCPLDEEFDEFDEWSNLGTRSYHFNVEYYKKCVGTARIIMDSSVNLVAKVQRVCLLKEYRSKGLGLMLMQKIHDFLKEENIFHVELSAQITAIDFYEKIGYETEGGTYLDAGIVHKKMSMKLV